MRIGLSGLATCVAISVAAMVHPARADIPAVQHVVIIYQENRTPDNLFHGLREFREHLGGELTIQMLEDLGVGFNVHEIDEPLMAEAILLLERESHRFDGIGQAMPESSRLELAAR